MPGRSSYFSGLESALKAEGIYNPVLVLDLDRLDQNIETLLSHLPHDMGYRVVAKSLPVPKLLSHICKNAGTDKLMTFNMSMLNELIQNMPEAHQLLGKPMPAKAFREFIKQYPSETLNRIHWLIDTPARLEAYHQILQSEGCPTNIVLELNIGLHRGGFLPDDDLVSALKKLHLSTRLTFTGFMGYEPHLASIPKALGWRTRSIERAWSAYRRSLVLASGVFGEPYMDTIIRNIAGSPTYRLYEDSLIGNEVSVGSALVKPSDFDTEMLKGYLPACFIAAPVLKAVGKTRLPALEFAEGIQRMIFPKMAQTFFIHGGKWMADPVSPPKLKYNKVFGRSSNQEMLNGPSDVNLSSGDFVFLRPHQSEAVLLQFGDLVVIRDMKVVDHWPTFSVST